MVRGVKDRLVSTVAVASSSVGATAGWDRTQLVRFGVPVRAANRAVAPVVCCDPVAPTRAQPMNMQTGESIASAEVATFCMAAVWPQLLISITPLASEHTRAHQSSAPSRKLGGGQ